MTWVRNERTTSLTSLTRILRITAVYDVQGKRARFYVIIRDGAARGRKKPTAMALWWIVSRLAFLGLDPIHLHNRPIVLYSVALLLLGGQLMSIGFVAELVIAYHDPDIKSYSISQQTETKSQDKAG